MALRSCCDATCAHLAFETYSERHKTPPQFSHSACCLPPFNVTGVRPSTGFARQSDLATCPPYRESA